MATNHWEWENGMPMQSTLFFLFLGPRCDSVTLESCLLCQPKLDWVAPWTPQNKTEKKIKINENMIKELKREKREKKSHEYKPHLF